MTLADLRELERLRGVFDAASAERKLKSLRALARDRLTSALALARLHECLCFASAYPDDARVLSAVRSALERFAARPDLARQRRALEGSGIAGTELCFRFYQPTAAWLCQRFPRALTIEWDEFEGAQALERWLPQLLAWGESALLDGPPQSLARRLERLRGPGESDACFLVRRVQALDAAPLVRRQIYEELDPPLRLHSAAGTPSRTLAALPVRQVAFQARPWHRERPDLKREIERPARSIRAVGPREGAELVRLARDAMVVRQRDLDAFMAADARDVRWIDAGEGLAFVAFGVVPEERLLLESVYAFLTLKNGVPIGYVLASALFGSCQVAYNVFETWRGGESAWIYARALSMLRALFGCDSFYVDPYQLGHENEEGLASGAWWFYQKLGFRPDERRARSTMRAEMARIRRRPSHRSSRATLERLVRHPLFWSPGRTRADVLGRFPLESVAEVVARSLAWRGAGELELAERACEREGLERLGLRPSARALRGWTKAERLAWRRWAPLVVGLRGVEDWPTRERAALLQVVRAKGGLRETEFVRRFDAHRRLRRALCELARVRSSV